MALGFALLILLVCTSNFYIPCSALRYGVVCYDFEERTHAIVTPPPLGEGSR